MNMKLPSLKTMSQAGGRLNVELQKDFVRYAKERNVNFFIMYGQTETTARMSYLSSKMASERYGSIGIPIPKGQFELIDELGNKIECSNKTGEMVYYGENVFMGYTHGKKDLAGRDEEGYYYIEGHKNRYLKIYGNRVNLDECENILAEQFPYGEMVCMGEEDCMRIYTTTQNRHKEIIDFISVKTGLHRKAFKVIYLKEIPRNERGKVQWIKDC